MVSKVYRICHQFDAFRRVKMETDRFEKGAGLVVRKYNKDGGT